ncbi:MAG: glycosyltransferase family 39 protein, partial [Acidobacteria bacterium]|nr:glycosyltransferase family 39 protein [Acidobacteriota bacterium]
MIVAIIGSLSLHETFSGDQALFMTYAKAIDHGAVLYRDVWDIKQPAVFSFYWLAGKLFSFDEVGGHLLELLYFCALALFLLLAVRKYFTRTWVALATPLLTLGIYYAVSQTLHFTQVEALASFPLFVSLWLCQKYLERPDKKSLLILSGLFGGVAVSFKLLFIAIPLAFWIWTLFHCYRRLSHGHVSLMKSTGALALGFSIPIGASIGYFAYHDSLGILWYTTFQYPYIAARTVDQGDRSEFLIGGVVWFLKAYFPALFLTAALGLLRVGSLVTGRPTRPQAGNVSVIFTGSALWLITGVLVIFVQRLSWWEYHYSLLMVPVGLLAARAVDEILQFIHTYRTRAFRMVAQTAVAAVIVASFIPTYRRLADRILEYSRMETVRIGDADVPLTGNTELYKRISAEMAPLSGDLPSKIVVLGNPVYYSVTGATPAISSNPWMLEGFTPVEWQKFDQEFADQRPEVVIVQRRELDYLTA